MKHVHLPKTLLLTALLLSFCSFLFVNVHAELTPSATPAELTALQSPAAVEDCNESNGKDFPIPDVTVFGRLLELAQKLAGRG